jgi:prephenate dehydratase/prephenate dehydrogenase
MNKKSPVIGIVGGNGKMGRLFAEFFCDRGITALISDINTKLSNKNLVEKSDIVIISVPIDKTEKLIKEILPYFKKGSAITDFTSVKEMPINAMMKAKTRVEVFGMHPMFGNSNPIPGQTIILCPTKKTGKWYEWMKNFLGSNGANIKIMTPKEHDRVMAVAQDLIHFVEITCADGLRFSGVPINNILKYVSLASELKIMSSSRILDQDAGLYGNMQFENKYNLKYLNRYKNTVENLIKIIKEKDVKAFKKYFRTTRKYLGSYADKAYKDSSFLIDKLIEKRNRENVPGGPRKNEIPTKKHLALLGPPLTFSDLAADMYLDETTQAGDSHCATVSRRTKSEHPACPACERVLKRTVALAGRTRRKFYAKTIEEVFDLVEKGKVAQGIVPMENKLDGSVKETLDNLFLKKIHFTASISLPIHHCLSVLPFAKVHDIKKIVSHEQALNQCKKYLKAHFFSAEKEPYSSTTSAIEKLIFSNDKTIAIISSKQAAENFNLKIIAENIEDNSSNSTQFIIIKKGHYSAANPVQKNRTSIAFHFDEDSPGSLFSVLEDFAKAKINLTKIESRPTKKEFGDYIFYLDFNGSPEDKKIKLVLSALTKKVAKIKILGSF